jgi:hypothetical protein
MCFLPEKGEFRNEGLRMIVQRLTGQLFLTTNICIISISKNPGSRNLANQKIPKPKDTVLGCPRGFTVAVQAMDSNNTMAEVFSVVVVICTM